MKKTIAAISNLVLVLVLISSGSPSEVTGA